MPIRRSIHYRILLILALSVCIPAFLVIAAAGLASTGSAQRQTYHQLENAAALKAAWISDWQASLPTQLYTAISPFLAPGQLWMVEAVTRGAAAGETDRTSSAAYTEAYQRIGATFGATIAGARMFREIFLVDLQGHVVLSTLAEREKADVSGQPYFDPDMPDPRLTSIYLEEGSGEITQVVVNPVANPQGHTMVLLVGRVDLDRLRTITAERTGMGENDETYLVMPPDILLTPLRFSDLSPGQSIWATRGVRAALSERGNGQNRYRGYHGATVLGVYRWLPELGAALLAEGEPATSSLAPIAITAAVAALLSVLAASTAAWRITGPLGRLVHAAEDIAAEQQFRRLPDKTPALSLPASASVQDQHTPPALVPASLTARADEIGALARILAQLASRQDELAAGLEAEVSMRTAGLERRYEQIRKATEVAREIARDAASFLPENDGAFASSLDACISRAAARIAGRFEFNQAGIYLIDERREWAILWASSGGESGRRLRVGASEAGIVGFVAGTGHPRISLQPGENDQRSQNSQMELPSSLLAPHSLMALPLKAVSGRVIGVLEIQGDGEIAFEDEDVHILQTVADHLAISIEIASARSHDRAYKPSSEGQYIREEHFATALELEPQAVWRDFLQRRSFSGVSKPGKGVGIPTSAGIPAHRGVTGYRYRGLGVEASQELSDEGHQAIQENRTIVVNAARPDEAASLAIPIRLRGQVIGVLNVRFEEAAITPETAATFEEIAIRLSLVLENARLHEEARRLAERQAQINLISTQVRGSVDMDTILQNTVREMGKAMGSSRAFIQIGLGTAEGDRPQEGG